MNAYALMSTVKITRRWCSQWSTSRRSIPQTCNGETWSPLMQTMQ